MVDTTPAAGSVSSESPRHKVGDYVTFAGLKAEIGRVEYVSTQASDGEQLYAVTLILRESQLTPGIHREAFCA